MAVAQSPLVALDKREEELLKELEEIRAARRTVLRYSPNTEAAPAKNTGPHVRRLITVLKNEESKITPPLNCRTALIKLLKDAPNGMTKQELRDGLRRLGVNVSENTFSWQLSEHKHIFKALDRGIWALVPGYELL